MGNGDWGLGTGEKAITNYQLPITHYPSGSPVAHGGNPQDRTGSPITNYQLPITQFLIINNSSAGKWQSNLLSITV
ncbi:hypothetical protein [Cylindrospermum sp. FACHB-282]|uniref:hypothetical protein n=1 Tax=Cylindrospermum sp. FACHB-282 TaxID=2692794 RepID=UPI0016865CF0|nr:hypothetical protein [Cylindrospermum sp. FACHB-282]MBD2387627.1 hypothetical protein [Cylindrospermum sp. FACHB-282]